MWKISVVMLVTAAFAGLLIYNPYGMSSEGAAPPTNVRPRPANRVSAPAQAETAPVAEAPMTITPQDVEVIVLKVLADRTMPQERDSPEVVGALPDKPVATVAPPPLATPNGFQRPVLQSGAQTPLVQPVLARHEDPPVSRVAVSLPSKPVVTIAPRPLPVSL